MKSHREAIKHIRYEFECFFNSSQELITRLKNLKGRAITPMDVVETALFDSFQIHLRVLYSFFTNKDNIQCKFYINEDSKEIFDSEIQDLLVRILDCISKNDKKDKTILDFNKSTFHLSFMRCKEYYRNKKWDTRRIRELILEITKVFQKYIAEEYQDDFRYLDQYIRTEEFKVNKTNFALTPISPDEIETDQESTEHNDFSATLNTGSAFDAAMTSTSKPIHSDKP
jgi:hypothetical protein